MTPKLEGMAAYAANLIALSKELPEAAEIRVELGRAIEALQKEIQAASKKRAA